MGGTVTVRRFDGIEALSRAAAEELGAIIREAVAARGVAHVALSGGSTPKKLFQLMSAMGPDAHPWAKIHLWWGDERTVPPEHADSNFRMTREALLEPLLLIDREGVSNIHRIRGEGPDHAASARDYEAELSILGSPPVFDYVMLGMGPDGHTASLFPGSPAVARAVNNEPQPFVVANPVDSPLTKGPTTRITLTAAALNAGRHIRFLAAGADKAEPLAQVLSGARDPQKYPSQLIAPSHGGDLVWFVDHAAAAKLGADA